MSPSSQPEPIAIIGAACRLPGGASSPSKLWDLLSAPCDLLSKIPSDRFDPDGFYHPDGEHHGATNVRHAYLLSEDPRHFDAAFFSINPREAEEMDPQHRLLLETVYEALESAGLTIPQLQGSQTGVYVGLMTNDFLDVQNRDLETIPKYAATGTNRCILSNRVSYFFDWKGPSMTIDTACSSSLVAVHLAVQSLRSKDSHIAVAAGSNLIFGPESFITESKLHMLSPSGRSRMWDDKADGYGRGEGVAAIILKTLSAAIQDGDHIECIIRETGVNQDGRTPGITMPNPRSQEALIRDTYRRAGLDLRKREDRPQYFEAHGTGTAVGDPLEAEAISNAFFGEDTAPSDLSSSDVLFVGGIKTVIGHLEGAAGLAGLLKAALALKHRSMPPNMLLENLNPKVAPFTKHLRVPTTLTPWPQVPGTTVRRASVNSFGFGGTNAHAILESFDETESPNGIVAVNGLSASPTLMTPFVFSAHSDSSLIRTVEAFVHHLTANPTIDMLDLAWTLQAGRTDFAYRKAFSGSNIERLLANLSEALAQKGKTLGTNARYSNRQRAPKILGVFTGQGAQWPTMGAELLRASEVFSQAIDNLEDSLQQLADGPTWSIRQELLAVDKQSRIHVAEISQPLCTAVQIGLVDLIRTAGISLHAVVGHSSGEIAAAYAAGIISARDAIRIAYYRGLHAKHAAGKAGQSGAMMAAGLSFAQAQSLCAHEQFKDRIGVAASNGPLTVTISGDRDAIQELKAQLDEQKTFARLLHVDTAYHSYHMLPCSELYLQSLQGCRIQISQPNHTHWVSSVHGVPEAKKQFTYDTVADVYWVENMVNPVLFSQAIERAVALHGPFDVAIEIGPHPALKGPTTQTIEAISGNKIPYHGTLHRGNNDAESFSSALGFIWEHLGSEGVDLGQFTTTLRKRAPVLLKDLPPYQWDHHQQYWKESRLSRNFRTRGQQGQELLGKQCSDNVNTYDLRWRNILTVEEIPWLQGHKFQNQILLPAAAHVALALEASKVLSAGRPRRLIELEDISVTKAITLEEDGPGVEILFALKTMTTSPDSVTADFACYACRNDTAGNMDRCSSGRVTLYLGPGSADVLPAGPTPKSGLIAVDTDEFYKSMSHVGLDYSREFRGLDAITRTRLYARASTMKPAINSDYAEAAMVHPTLLDVCFQAVFAAFCFPDDGSLRTPYLPTRIKRIRVNPLLCEAREDPRIDIHAQIVKESPREIVGDLNAYNRHGQLEIQLEGLTFSSLSQATPETDSQYFAETVWRPVIEAEDYGDLSGTTGQADNPTELDAIQVNERVAYYYLRTLPEQFSPAEVANFEWWYQCLFEFADHILPIIANGDHPSIRAEWANDTAEDIQNLVRRYPNQIDLQLVVEVGESLPAFVRGNVPMLEVLTKEDRLSRLREDGLGIMQCRQELCRIAKQISHRYPGMKVLEISAGAGGMTKAVLKELDGAFGSYTFTDISVSERAVESFQADGGGDKMIFRALNIEEDPAGQGFTPGSYDVIIASNVLHATRKLGETMGNVRKLLRPGGYLLLTEMTGDLLRLGFIMGGLPSWWQGKDDGRRYSPTINCIQWDEMLRDAGFSGVDIIRKDYNYPSKQLFSVIVTQAVDEMVDFLREPLLSPYMAPEVEQLIIVGGKKSLHVRRLARGIANQLRTWTPEITFVDDLLALQAAAPSSGFTVVCLEELEEPVLRTMTAEKLQGLQLLFSKARHILYLTQGCRNDSPYSMAMVGLGRTMLFEYPDLKLQFVDVATFVDADRRKIAEDLLRLVAAETLDVYYLWTVEPEVAYEGSQKYIPRLVSNKMLNNQLNSNARSITERISTKEWQAVLGRNGNDEPVLWKGKPRRSLLDVLPGGHVGVDISLSLAHPINLNGKTNLYLSIGKQKSSGGIVAVLSPECASAVVVPAAWACQISNPGKAGLVEMLRSIAMQLVAQQFLRPLKAGQRILLHDPDEQFARVLLQRAKDKDVSVILTTSDSRYKNKQPWVWLHPLESRHRIFAVLPAAVDVLIDLSSDDGSSSEPLGKRIASRMPQTCLVLHGTEIFQNKTSSPKMQLCNDLEGLATFFQQACLSATADMEARSGPAVRIDELIAGTTPLPLPPFSVIDWTADTTLSISIKPTVTDGLFSSEKTYILFGLTGDTGRSLTSYMIDNGARYIVLTSRNPSVDDAWLEEQGARGAIVKILAADITQKAEVQSLVDEVRKKMPRIGGIVNGAMVLQNKPFGDMDLEDWNMVVKPKIDGSRHLDEIFSDDKSLEFFIMFSSQFSVIGNGGQSNYNAANMYCNGLATCRRRRGLAASAMDIGKLAGIGVSARSYKGLRAFQQHRFPNMSEAMFHQMFAEAIISGRPDSGRRPVISLAMPTRSSWLGEQDSSLPLWNHNPRFAHMKWEEEGDTRRYPGSAAANQPVKDTLKACKDASEAEDILCRALSAKLATILQFSADAINRNTPLVDIGVDSLVAMQVQAWFLKELHVDVPMLKIIGGGSIAALCREALSKMSSESS